MLTEIEIQNLKSKNIEINNNPFVLQARDALVPVNSYTDLLKYFKVVNITSTDLIIQRFRELEKPLYPVGVQGLSDISTEEEIGSRRITVHDTALANYLSDKILPFLPKTVVLSDTSPMDWQTNNPDELNTWELESVSPVFRYMEYSKGGKHNPHYDSEYIDPQDPLHRTLFSGVLYLSTNSVSTRIIDDRQDDISLKDRDLTDHSKPFDSSVNSLYLTFPSQAGYVSIFPHRVCHDVSENYEEKLRIIIRFDIFCKAIK